MITSKDLELPAGVKAEHVELGNVELGASGTMREVAAYDIDRDEFVYRYDALIDGAKYYFMPPRPERNYNVTATQYQINEKAIPAQMRVSALKYFRSIEAASARRQMPVTLMANAGPPYPGSLASELEAVKAIQAALATGTGVLRTSYDGNEVVGVWLGEAAFMQPERGAEHLALDAYYQNQSDAEGIGGAIKAEETESERIMRVTRSMSK